MATPETNGGTKERQLTFSPDARLLARIEAWRRAFIASHGITERSASIQLCMSYLVNQGLVAEGFGPDANEDNDPSSDGGRR